MGADLVGKVEAGIPEDDPRNPAVIADNVGDNVGDVAGMGADLFESLRRLHHRRHGPGRQHRGGAAPPAAWRTSPLPAGRRPWASSPRVHRARSSCAPGSGHNPGRRCAPARSPPRILALARQPTCYCRAAPARRRASGCSTPSRRAWSSASLSASSPSTTRPPTTPRCKGIAEASLTGTATNIISGLAGGHELAPRCPSSFIGDRDRRRLRPAGLYGIAMPAVGMLATTGMTIAVDAYGPIADNAGGIAEMAGLPERCASVTDQLDSVGNTTAAMAKGFAIGSAALTALALFSAYATAAGIERHRHAPARR